MSQAFKNKQNKALVGIICFHNLIAFCFVMRLLISGGQAGQSGGEPTPILVTIISAGIVLLFFISTIALWLKKEWAYIVQVLIYSLQLFAIQSGGFRFSFFLGFQYPLTINFSKFDPPPSIAINLVALFMLLLLLIVKSEYLSQKQVRP